MNIEKFENQNPAKQALIVEAGIKEFSQKAYADASTDAIVKSCGISKGLLFHYFGSKKDFYIYCLEKALEILMQPVPRQHSENDFYEILFNSMDQKLRLCCEYPDETLFVNMASREAGEEVSKDKTKTFAKYAAQKHMESSAILERAIATLSIAPSEQSKTKQGLLLYINAIMSNYLLVYQNRPKDFFENSNQIKLEIKEYINLMLYGLKERE